MFISNLNLGQDTRAGKEQGRTQQTMFMGKSRVAPYYCISVYLSNQHLLFLHTVIQFFAFSVNSVALWAAEPSTPVRRLCASGFRVQTIVHVRDGEIGGRVRRCGPRVAWACGRDAKCGVGRVQASKQAS